MTDFHWLSAQELQSGYASQAFSPLDVTRAILDRIETLNDQFQAFAWIDRLGALDAAALSTKRWQQGQSLGPGDGIPTTIKDLILTEGWPCRRGSRTTSDQPSTMDAPVVSHLRRAGAVLLGSTTTPEFGWKAVTDNPLGQIARNPYNAAMTTGGSSGGAAAAAALGLGVWHVGTDGGGSIRVPAGFCGLFGLKPTFGRVPALPLSPFGTVSHLGPITRTVADGVAMFKIMSQPDARDWHNLPAMPTEWLATKTPSVNQLKIAVSPDLGHLQVEPDIRRAFDQAIAKLAELGAQIDWIDPPIAPCESLFNTHWYSGAANLFSSIEPAQQALIDPGLRAVAAAGAALDGETLRLAAMARSQLGEAMQSFLLDYDLLATPTTTIAAFSAGCEVPPSSGLGRWIEWAGFSYPFNLTQQPAITLRCGTTEQGLPASLQLVAAKYREPLLLDTANALEASGLGFQQPNLD